MMLTGTGLSPGAQQAGQNACSAGSAPFCFCSSARGLWLGVLIKRARKPAADCVCKSVEALCDGLTDRGGHIPPLFKGILSLHKSALGFSTPCSKLVLNHPMLYRAVLMVNHLGHGNTHPKA